MYHILYHKLYHVFIAWGVKQNSDKFQIIRLKYYRGKIGAFQTMITVLKIIGIIGSAGFGIYGSLVDLRDTDGRITLQGKFILIGIFICASIIAGTQIHSENKSEEDAIELLKGNKLILEDINRSLHPLPGMSASFNLRPDWEHPQLAKVLVKIIEKDRLLRDFENTVFGFGNYPVLLESNELKYSLCGIRPVLFFYKNPIDPKKFRFENPTASQNEDLRINISNPCEGDRIEKEFYELQENRKNKPSLEKMEQKTSFVPNRQTNYGMEFRKEDGKIIFFDMSVREVEIDSTSNSWVSNSRISSVFDLLGSQLIIQLTSSGGYLFALDASIPNQMKEIDSLRAAVSLSNLVLRIPNGITLAFDKDNLQEYTNEKGMKYYSITFPNDMERLIELLRYDSFESCCSPLDL